MYQGDDDIFPVSGKGRYSLGSRLRSFKFAFSGLRSVLRSEPNIAIHIVISILVVIAGFVRGLDSQRWATITIAIALVFVAEILNTSIEKLCNFVCEGKYHPLIKQVKDIAAAAVLVAAIASIVLGIIVFIF